VVTTIVAGLARSACRIAAITGIFLACLEICARLDDHWRWGAPLAGDYSNEQLRVTDHLGQRCRPNAQFEKWRLNSFGFRGAEVSEQKPKDVTRVLLVGASETFGLYESPGHEYPAQLKQTLEERSPGRFQILNAACAGMSPPRIEHQFKTWLWKLAPDVVLFYPSPQFYLDDDPPRFTAATPTPSSSAFVSRLGRKLKIALKGFLPARMQTWLRETQIRRATAQHGEGWVWSRVPEERLSLFREQVGDLISSVQTAGARPMLVTHASRFADPLSPRDRAELVALRVFYPRASETVILDFERAANQIIREIAEARHLSLIDAEQALGKNPASYADFAHLTDTGASAMAGLLADALEKLDLGTAKFPEGSSK
jgi:hypothetical protein